MSPNRKPSPKMPIKVPALSPELREQYEKLLSWAKCFGKPTAEGVDVGGTVHSSLTGRIVSWRLYLYRWVEGQGKQEYPFEGTSES